jgi:hypothetical protein
MAGKLELNRLKSERKLRLFACACVREVWHQLNCRVSRQAVEVAERFVDGLATAEEMSAARAAAERVVAATSGTAREAAWAATDAAAPPVGVRATRKTARNAAAAAMNAAHFLAYQAARKHQALLLDDIAGPDPLPELPRSPTAVALAEAVYQERQWQDLPVLADALEEAGCTDAGILSHLRGPGPHARGCWAVDLVRSVD